MTTLLPSDLPCAGVIDQRLLYERYRRVPDVAGYAEMLELEQRWIVRLARHFEASAPEFGSRRAIEEALRDFLGQEGRAESENHHYLATRATLAEFKIVVAEFAIDGLTESLSLMPIVARLPYRSGMAVFRIIIDELGCGNEEQAHSQLYRNLLGELGMPLDVEHYLDIVGPESLAYVNMFHWLAARALEPEYFLGGYAYFEGSVLYGFRSFAQAAQRLGLTGSRYYTEHLYIDHFHSRQMRTAIRAKDDESGLDLAKLWAGVELTSAIVTAATEAAISRARAQSPLPQSPLPQS